MITNATCIFSCPSSANHMQPEGPFIPFGAVVWDLSVTLVSLLQRLFLSFHKSLLLNSQK